MADLIARALLYEKRQPVDFLYGHDEDAPYSGMAVSACDVESAPAVDAVEVVRCKDCKHYGEYNYCWIHSADVDGTPIFVRDNDFCSYGERRTDEEGV